MERNKNNGNKEIEELINKCKKEPSSYIEILQNIFCGNLKNLPFPNSKLSNFHKYQKKIVTKIESLKVEEKEEKYNCLSCIYGAFLGDAIGSFCEFSKANKANHYKVFKKNNIFGKPAGTITDDSEMAMSLAYSIMDLPDLRKLNSTFIFFYYQFWLISKPFDSGITIRKALQSSQIYDLRSNYFDKVKKQIQIQNQKSKANGFLMRISPFVVWFYYMNKNEVNSIIKAKKEDQYYNLFMKIKEYAFYDNCITHPNIENNYACGLFVFISLSAIVKNEPEDIIKQLKYLLQLKEFDKEPGKEIRKQLNDCFKKIESNNFNYDFNFQSGYYIHAFRLTIYYLIKFNEYKDKDIYNSIMNQICDFGGDTDTNAAIVGTVIGPLIGYFNFGNHFLPMISLNHSQRIQFSPFIMYEFVEFLENNIKEGKYVDDETPRYYTLQLFLNMLTNP